MKKIILLLLLLIAGCASEAEFLTITEVTPSGEEYSYDSTLLAQDVELFWNQKHYDVLYDLFTPTFREQYTKEAFVWLAEKEDELLRINNITVTKVEEDLISFSIDRERYVTTTHAQVNSGLLEPFYFFKEFNVDVVCGRVASEKTHAECGLDVEDDLSECQHDALFQCYYDYALFNKEQAFCDATGFLKDNCFKLLGIQISKEERIESCFTHFRDSQDAACLEEYVRKTKDVDYCLAIPYSRLRFRCVGTLAGIMRSIIICDTHISANPNKENSLACYTNYAKETGDNHYCFTVDPEKNIVAGALAEECTKY